jgi:dissimilatory sulfite reductase (desulfoviridin) alpha/beta subunit
MMNEKKRKNVVEEAEMEPADIPAPVAKNYTLRGALQAIERREAAVAKREQKILKLQAENNADRKLIKQLNDVCAEIRQQELMQRVKLLSSSGNEMTTERINKLLDFFEQAGDALTGLSLEQLIAMLQGSPEQALELAEEAKVINSENTGDTDADESV